MHLVRSHGLTSWALLQRLYVLVVQVHAFQGNQMSLYPYVVLGLLLLPPY